MAKKDNMDAIKQDLIEINNRMQRLEGDVADQVGDFAQHIKHKAIEKKEEFGKKVSDNPYQSVGIAFGTGVLAGMIVKHIIHNRR